MLSLDDPNADCDYTDHGHGEQEPYNCTLPDDFDDQSDEDSQVGSINDNECYVNGFKHDCNDVAENPEDYEEEPDVVPANKFKHDGLYFGKTNEGAANWVDDEDTGSVDFDSNTVNVQANGHLEVISSNIFLSSDDDKKHQKAINDGESLAKLAIIDSRCANLFNLVGNSSEKIPTDRNTPEKFLDWAIQNVLHIENLQGYKLPSGEKYDIWGITGGYTSNYSVTEPSGKHYNTNATNPSVSQYNGKLIKEAGGSIKVHNGISSSKDFAYTLIHELGHLANLMYGGHGAGYSDVYGEANSKIVNDAGADKKSTDKLEKQNRDIMKDCEKAIKEIAKTNGYN